MRQLLLQIATACLLQSATSGITMCDNFIIKKSATEDGSQLCNISCILNICRQYYLKNVCDNQSACQ